MSDKNKRSDRSKNGGQGLPEQTSVPNLPLGKPAALDRLMDLMPEPAAALGADGKLLGVNGGFTRAFGWASRELTGREAWLLFPGRNDLLAGLKTQLERAKTVNKVRTQLIDKKQNTLEVHLSASLIKDERGNASGMLLLLNDITQEVKLKRRLHAMLEISAKLAAYPSLDALLDFIGGKIKQNLETESASIMVLDPGRNEIYFRLIQAPQEEVCQQIKRHRFPADKGLAGHVLSTGQPLTVMDVQNDPRFYGRVDEGSGFVTRSLAYAPLILNQRRIGVLGAVNKIKGAFSQADQEFLVLLAQTVALAIETARVRDMEKLASTDSLTGLYNRRYLLERLREELQRSVRYRLSFSLVYMDLDKFKEVNDRFGHDQGDKVLQETAATINEIARKTDTVARFGGDEFVILLPETRSDEAMLMVSRIKGLLSGSRLPGDFDLLSASFGISTFDPKGPIADEEALLRSADQALLEAKRSGRGRIIQAGPA